MRDIQKLYQQKAKRRTNLVGSGFVDSKKITDSSPIKGIILLDEEESVG